MSELGFHSYCAICDLYFQDHDLRSKHIQDSLEHPQCSVCDRRFLNMNTLRNHKVLAPHHYYCRDCDRDFHTSGGLQVHLDTAAIHRDDSDDEFDEDEDQEFEEHEGWEDERGLDLYPDGADTSYKEQMLREVEEEIGDWENEDEFDFEDMEDLADPPFEFGCESDTDEDDEDQDQSHVAHCFTCPMCLESKPETVCTTACGHIFCAGCIVGALKYTQACPICDEPGDVRELRRVYLATNQ